jgi:hypothetical protein
MSLVYVYMWEFHVLFGPICVCLYVCMKMCQRLYETCTLLSLVSLRGPPSLFLPVLFHTLFNFTALLPFYHFTLRFLCFGSSFLGTQPFPDMSNMQLYSVG